MEESGEREQTEEPKVMKQVTFQDPDAEEKRPKKIRKRLKGLLSQLKSQMEFYFGDSNMSKDRFMKQKIDESSDGYIPLSMFMRFNKIRELTEDMTLLAKALQSSEMLQVNEEKNMVRRTTPIRYLTEDEIDDRTVYVEGFPKALTHEWFYKMFSSYGKVAYVSLPRFKSSNDVKGFAFVEFETCEGAAKAIEMLSLGVGENGKIEKLQDKVGGSIKQSSNLKYLKKRAAREGIDVEELEAVKDEPPMEDCAEKEESKEGKKSKKKKKKKRRSTISQMEATASAEANSGKVDGASITKEDENAQKEATIGANDNANPKKSKKPKRKRKRSSGQIGESAEGSSVSQDSSVPVVPSKRVGELLESGADLSRSSDDSDTSTKKSKKKVKDEMREASEVPSSSGDSDGKRKKSKKDEVLNVAVPESSGDLGSVKDITVPKRSDDCSESDNQHPTSRKRRLMTDENSELTPTKIIKKEVDLEEDFSLKQEKNEEGGIPDSTEDQKSSKQLARESSEDLAKESDLQKDRNRKRKRDSEEAAQDGCSNKTKMGKQLGHRRSTEQTDQQGTVGLGKKRKRRHAESTESVEDSGKKKKMRRSQGSATEEEQKGDGEDGVKKKKNRRAQRKMQTLRLVLRIMSKKEWFSLKQEYLSLQKKNMKKLKEQLQTAARNRNKQKEQNSGDTQAVQETNTRRPPPEFVPNVILEIKSDVGMSHKSIKEEIPAPVEVSYIDVKPGMTTGHIRCKDASSASMLLKRGIEGCTLSLVEGAAEKMYWEKLIKDRKDTLSKTKRPKQRGKTKLLQRAQNPLGEIFTGQHLKFNDDHNEREQIGDAEYEENDSDKNKERENWELGPQHDLYSYM